MSNPASWERRVHNTVLVGQWFALLIGVVSDFAGNPTHPGSVVALTLAGLYVASSSAIPIIWYAPRFGAEAITLIGALMTVGAMTLTGGAGSPYLLLATAPPILATTFGGLRRGMTTGLLSASLLILVTISRRESLLAALGPLALFVVFVALMSPIKRILEDMHERAADLEAENIATTEKLARLEEIHKLLVKLSADLSSGQFNAIEVGADTLDRILDRFPSAAGQLVLESEGGAVVLAARGIADPGGQTAVVRLAVDDSSVGHLELTTPTELDGNDRELLTALVEPVALAYANLQLLQEIAGSAVAEERLRLARELHDTIGPSLATLGLGLDVAVQAAPVSTAVDLKVMRTNVTKLVEDVRSTVADLRSTPGPTLTARILRLAASLKLGPQIVVDIDERRPPRPAVIGEITAIVTEAVRNAHAHSKANKVLVTGRVDRARGRCVIEDDGIGFDPEVEPRGHFGLIGMRERADGIDAAIEIKSVPQSGTTVVVEWGQR